VDKEVAQKRKKTSRAQVSSTRRKKRGMLNAEAKHIKELLLKKRREILRNVNEFEDEALKKSRLDATGDLSSMPIHMADLGTDNYEQEFALGLMDSERKLLREIDNALGRIEKKTYGICEGTGKPIPKARLEAQPWARYCVEYARMLEQGLVVEQEE
jgi:DnaK suppressor protein